jgi:holo-[acyl-carrier protein] synthase
LVKSVGLDLVEVARIQRDLDRYGERFARRILGEQERVIFAARRDRALFLAGRFAAKEAVIKALGYYLTSRPALGELQVIRKPGAQPQLLLSERVRQALPAHNCLISIAHEKNYAVAVAVFEEDE